MKSDSTKLIDILGKVKLINSSFEPFACHEWIYDSYQSDNLATQLSAEDREIFNFDIT